MTSQTMELEREVAQVQVTPQVRGTSPESELRGIIRSLVETWDYAVGLNVTDSVGAALREQVAQVHMTVLGSAQAAKRRGDYFTPADIESATVAANLRHQGLLINTHGGCGYQTTKQADDLLHRNRMGSR